MDDDLDMSMRAPYISMSESSELPMLIAEDLMWGAQPNLKHTFNVNRKIDLIENNRQIQTESFESPMKTYQQQRSSIESSLASLLCNQLLNHQKQQIQEQQNHQTQHPIILNSHPDVKIQILEQVGNTTRENLNEMMLQNHETSMGLSRLSFPLKLFQLSDFFSWLFSNRFSWMDDEWSSAVEETTGNWNKSR